ncbi:MAG: hypothetical protein ABSB42_09360 [Tepidisphaeraceae bacterium]|jgi:hypothetical protein
MLKPPAKGKAPTDKPTPRLAPRPMLFKVLCVVFAIWMAALLVMYFWTVYPLRHPSR